MFYGTWLSPDLFYEMAKTKKVVLFGASGSARTFIESGALEGVEVSYFCDNDETKWNNEFLGIKISPPSRLLEEDRERCVVLVTSTYVSEIKTLWKDYGYGNVFSHHFLLWPTEHLSAVRNLTLKSLDKFERVESILEDGESKRILRQIVLKRLFQCPVYSDIEERDEYFKKDILSFSNDEVYVDAGMYDGDSIRDFIGAVDGRYKKIYGFEPDEGNFQKAVSNFGGREGLELSPYGLWKENGTLEFDSKSNEASAVSVGGNGKIKVVRLDDAVRERVTFIKMDVEGAELETIEGSKKAISKYKPKLAVCLYHKPEDLYAIPIRIKELVPEYRLYVRHHGCNRFGTVLYATL